MKKLFIFILMVFSCLTLAQEQSFLSHEIENEKQTDFPGLAITAKERPILYVVDINKASLQASALNAEYIFEEKMKLNPGEKIKISSYIIAKDLLDSINLISISNKTTRNEIISIFNSGDMKSIQDLILKLAEKRRVARDEKELQKVQNEIYKFKTGDDASSATYFQTGMIEILPPNGKGNVRFFIPFDQIENLDISQGEAKVNIIKSVSLLGFKNIKSNINFGSLSEETIHLIDQVESSLQEVCGSSCPIQQNLQLGDFMNDVVSLSTYSLLNEIDLDFEMLSQGAMLQQACLLEEMNKLCSNDKLTSSIQKFVSEKKVADFIQSTKQKFPKVCAKFYVK